MKTKLIALMVVLTAGFCTLAFGLPALESSVTEKLLSGAVTWEVLPTVEFKGKQDDLFLTDHETGWYVNGKGYIYRTSDGGKTWNEQLSQPGTFFRAIGMVDKDFGFVGNIGPDYFPGVTDTIPLYQTQNGGQTWEPVQSVGADMITGICAIDILKTEFINSGILDYKITIRAAGRVGGPATIITSKDRGQTWTKARLGGTRTGANDFRY